MKNPIITFITIAVAASLSMGALATAENADVQLKEVKKAKLSTLYIDKDHDYSQYDSIYIADVDVSDPTVKMPSKSRSHREDWEWNTERQEQFQEDYRDSFKDEFAKDGNLEIVNEPGEGTLILAARLQSVAPSVGYDVNNYAGRSRTFSDTSGSAVLEFYLIDGQTGELIAVGADAHRVGTHWVNNNSVTNSANVKRTLNHWARMMSDATQEMPERVEKADIIES